MRNQELFNAIAQKIREEPRRYNQFHWESESPCGTAYCIGGWGLVLSGKEPYQVEYIDGEYIYASIWISDELGLSRDEGRFLFSASWTPREDLTVPEALEKIGAGAKLAEVTSKASIDIYGEFCSENDTSY